MPTVEENREKWTVHQWVRDGHEWSPGGTPAGTDLFWFRSILPRLHAHLPAGTLLEIAPGFGRWTAYLAGHCARLIAVDVTERCVELCRERFAGRPGTEFHLNDGESLPMVADGSIDLAFSFDSLVHVEAAQIRAYLFELGRVLKMGGSGFIHHSNLGAYAQAGSGAIPPWIAKRHWRAASVSAASFRDACRAAGLHCVSQEIINWAGRGARSDRYRLPAIDIPLTDCISVVAKPVGQMVEPPARVHINRRFVDEWWELLVLVSMYGAATLEQHTAPIPDAPASYARNQPSARPPGWRSYAWERWTASAFRRNERIVNSVARGSCPHCGSRLSQQRCSPCNVEYTLS